MWTFDMDIFEKMGQPCLLDLSTGRFREPPKDAVEELLDELNRVWGDGVGMTMDALESYNCVSYRGTDIWDFIFTCYKESQTICIVEEFMSCDTDLYPSVLSLKDGTE